MLVIFERIDPGSPATSRLRVGPASIRSQDTSESQDPRCHLDIDEGHVLSEKERSMLIRRFDQRVEMVTEFLCLCNLRMRVLLLQQTVESGDNVPVDLSLHTSQGVYSTVQNYFRRRGCLTWSAHSRECALNFGSLGGRSGSPTFKSSN